MSRWVRFAGPAGPLFGRVDDDEVRVVEGTPFGEWRFAGRAEKLSELRLLVPVEPRVLYACGMNYEDHARHIAERKGIPLSLPPEPEIGFRSVGALVAHGEDIVVPSDATEKIHYEGELVAVIGRTTRNVTAAEALHFVFGYTIGNDVSERSWQMQDRMPWRAKNSDTFKPMGPWIETEVDLAAMFTEVRVNGEVRTRFRTAEMLFGVAETIAHISRYMTLRPGDVVWMGTGGFSPDLKHGDRVEITLDGIGTLMNPIRRAAPPEPVSEHLAPEVVQQ
jgi:2-keto-4-pentenoate hydratase/2-oxohepta-3-ene-1,7-dioic acid hydratase in catechol pathway